MVKSKNIKPIILIEGEIWKDVVGYEGHYAISSIGRVKSLSRVKLTPNSFFISQEIILKYQINKGGYIKVILLKNAQPKTFLVHRLMGIAFLENSENLPEINHKNMVRSDNTIENLEWVSKRENKTHGFMDANTINNHVGVYYEKRYNKWVAVIWADGKAKYIKSFKDENDAHDAYLKEMERLGLVNKYAS